MRVMHKLPVVPVCRTQSALLKTPNQKHHPAVPHSSEGRIAIVTDVERGMRWTRQRRALFARTNGADADGEVVWSWPPDAEAKFAMMLRITQATGARKPGPRGEREGNR
jgi:hypothetical protein